MVEFNASIKLDSASANKQMRAFASSTTEASITLRKFQDETRAVAQGGGSNVFRKLVNSSQKANQQILKSISLMSDQKVSYSKLTDEQKELVDVVDKLNLKYDESARAERELITIRKELRQVVASGLKTQKEADAIANREAKRIKESTSSYKKMVSEKKELARAQKAQNAELDKALVKFNAQYAIQKAIAKDEKQLTLLLKNKKISQREYNSLLKQTIKQTKLLVIENRKNVSVQQKMIKYARFVSVYSRLLLGTYMAIKAVNIFVEFEKTAESVRLLSQKLTFLTGDSGSYQKFFAMTQEVGINLTTASKIVTRFAVVTDKAFSTETMTDWAATLIKSGRAMGTSTQEMSGAMIQITQAMSAGRLMGDEYRSVTENLPLLTVALRDMFGKSTLSLKELSSQGLITNEVLIEAFGKTKELLKGFPDSTDTIEAAFARLSSSWDNFVGSIGETGIVKDFLNLLSGKINQLSIAIKGNPVKEASEAIRAMGNKLQETRASMNKLLNDSAKNGKKLNAFQQLRLSFLQIEEKSLTKNLNLEKEKLAILTNTSPEQIAKQQAEDKIQAVREQNKEYAKQLKLVQFIEGIEGGKAISTIKKRQVVDINKIRDEVKAGNIPEEEGARLENVINENAERDIKIRQKTLIDAELRINGFTSENNMRKIQEELTTTDAIAEINKKHSKTVLDIISNTERTRLTLIAEKDPEIESKMQVAYEQQDNLLNAANERQIAAIEENKRSIVQEEIDHANSMIALREEYYLRKDEIDQREKDKAIEKRNSERESFANNVNADLASIINLSLSKEQILDAEFQRNSERAALLFDEESNRKEILLQLEANYLARKAEMEDQAQKKNLAATFSGFQASLAMGESIKKKELGSTLRNGAAMLQFSAQQSEKMFKVKKAMALANAAVSLPSAVMQSFDNAGGWPYGLIPAGLMLIEGMAQINSIKNQQFGGGANVASIGGGGSNIPAPPQQTLQPFPSLAEKEQQSQTVNITFNMNGAVLTDDLVEIVSDAVKSGIDSEYLNIEIDGVPAVVN